MRAPTHLLHDFSRHLQIDLCLFGVSHAWNSAFWLTIWLDDSAQADGNSTGVGNPPGYCYKAQPEWSQYRESSFGHGTLDVLNSSHALWSCAVPCNLKITLISSSILRQMRHIHCNTALLHCHSLYRRVIQHALEDLGKLDVDLSASFLL